MTKKYMSMQEELAARKAEAGVETPGMKTRQEPEKEALSAKVKKMLEKGARKTAKGVENRHYEGVAISEHDVDSEPDPDEEEMSPMDDETGTSKFGLGSVLVITIAVIVIIFAQGLFSEDDDYDNWTDIYDYTEDTTDDEIVENAEDELAYLDPAGEAKISRWIEENDIGSMMGSDISKWHAEAKDYYVLIRVYFEEDELDDIVERCRQSTDNMMEALEESDMEGPPAVVMIARQKGDGSLLFLSMNDSIYFEYDQ